MHHRIVAMLAALVAAPVPALFAQCAEAELRGSNSGALDNFGDVVAIDGDIAVVGAQFHDGVGSDSGAVYVFERQAGTWVETAFLQSSDVATKDRFGSAVDVDGARIAVGVRYNDDPGYGGGNAYVFEKIGGVWTETQKVKALDEKADDFFGDDVALEGDLLLVGSARDDDAGIKGGSVYTFERQGGVYQQKQVLFASDAAIDDKFGQTLDVSGARALVGAPEDDDQGIDSGSVYVFEKQGPAWIEAAKLLPSAASPNDRFGFRVAIDGEVAVVGAPLADATVPNDGAAFVFERINGAWTETAYLIPHDPAPNQTFGASIAIDGDTILVGAWGHDGGGTNAGAVYVFTRSPSGWLEAGRLDGNAGDNFGYSAALDGGVGVIGARLQNNGGPVTGAAYVRTHVGNLAPYGVGCAGAGGFVPALRVAGCPSPGAAITLEITDGAGGAAAFLAAGLQTASAPMAGGCLLYVNPLLVLLGPLPLPSGGPGDGDLALPVAVPSTLAPATIRLQAFVDDAGAPAGFAASNGLVIEIE